MKIEETGSTYWTLVLRKEIRDEGDNIKVNQSAPKSVHVKIV